MKAKLPQGLYDEDLYVMANVCLNGKCKHYCNPARADCKNCRYSVYNYTDNEKKASYNYTLALIHYENKNERIRRENEYINRENQRFMIDFLTTTTVCILMYERWLTLIYGSNILLGLFFIRGPLKMSSVLFLLPIVCISFYKGMTEGSLKLLCAGVVLLSMAVSSLTAIR